MYRLLCDIQNLSGENEVPKELGLYRCKTFEDMTSLISLCKVSFPLKPDALKETLGGQPHGLMKDPGEVYKEPRGYPPI